MTQQAFTIQVDSQPLGTHMIWWSHHDYYSEPYVDGEFQQTRLVKGRQACEEHIEFLKQFAPTNSYQLIVLNGSPA